MGSFYVNSNPLLINLGMNNGHQRLKALKCS